MSQHSAEALKERYRFECRRARRRGTYEVDLVTTHTIGAVGELGEALPLTYVESRLEYPPVVLGERWARWKGQRMVAAAHRTDVKERQPWVVS